MAGEEQSQVRVWERDWRQTITEQMGQIAKTVGDTALVVREMQGDVKDLMEWKAAQEHQRDAREMQQPHLDRATLAIVISAIMAVIYALAFIAPHWH